MRKLVFINQHGSNKGDFAAFQSQLDIISKKYHKEDVNLSVIYNVTKVPFEIDKYENIFIEHYIDRTESKVEKLYYRLASIFPFLNAISVSSYISEVQRIISKADYIYLANGGANLGVYTDWRYLWRLSYASSNKNLSSFGNSIGKSKSDLFDRIKFSILRKFKSYLVRDLTSQEYLESNNIPCVPTLDVVYAKTPNLYKDFVADPKNDKFIVFTPNELHSWHPDFIQINLEKNYIEIMDFIISKGMKIVMLPQLFSDNHISDEVFYNQLASNCAKPEFCKVVPASSSVQDQLEVIANCEYVIGGRYHSLVFALSQDKPVVSLSYESKMSGMMRFFGLEDFSLDVSEFDYQKLVALMSSIESQRERFAVSEKAKNIVKKALSKL